MAVPPARARAAWPFALGALALGCVALAIRPPTWRSAITVALVGAIGLLGPVPQGRARAARWLAVVALGCLAFAATRVWGEWLTRPFTLAALGANTLAAVAEEAFFRRYMYGWLERWGAPIAIAGAALAFALVHVPQYGIAVVPLDLTAGMLLGWQRWASGSWTAPAATHAVANWIQMG